MLRAGGSRRAGRAGGAERRQLPGRDLGYIDFLVPGMVALTIMQLGHLQRGLRLRAAEAHRGAAAAVCARPTSPTYFLGAQVDQPPDHRRGAGAECCWGGPVVRPAAGGLASRCCWPVAALGSIVFLAMGFGVAGWAKNEDQAAPVANLISLPMTFLSGVFFPREAMPDVLQRITDFLPLTYLADALRQITNDGAGVADISHDLLGLMVWAVIAFLIGAPLFRWE
jgi:ABC-2 type transport system permease protein